LARQQPVEAEFACHAEHGGDVAVRQRAFDLERRGLGGQMGLALEDAAQRVQLVGWPMGEIGDGSALDLVTISVALAQEHGGWRGAIGDGSDIHARIASQAAASCQALFCDLHAYRDQAILRSF
jgi:hypothetical protein